MQGLLLCIDDKEAAAGNGTIRSLRITRRPASNEHALIVSWRSWPPERTLNWSLSCPTDKAAQVEWVEHGDERLVRYKTVATSDCLEETTPVARKDIASSSQETNDDRHRAS